MGVLVCIGYILAPPYCDSLFLSLAPPSIDSRFTPGRVSTSKSLASGCAYNVSLRTFCSGAVVHKKEKELNRTKLGEPIQPRMNQREHDGPSRSKNWPPVPEPEQKYTKMELRLEFVVRPNDIGSTIAIRASGISRVELGSTDLDCFYAATPSAISSRSIASGAKESTVPA